MAKSWSKLIAEPGSLIPSPVFFAKQYEVQVGGMGWGLPRLSSFLAVSCLLSSGQSKLPGS